MPSMSTASPTLTSDELVARAAAMRDELRERQADRGAHLLRGGHAPGVPRGGLLPGPAAASRRRPGARSGGVLPGRHGAQPRLPVDGVVLLPRRCARPAARSVLLRARADGRHRTEAHFVAASRDMPSGVVERVGDGWRVTGTWNYCSGAPWSTHFIARARMGHEPDAQLALVAIPRDGWRMLDDWHGILGMRGTGSHSIDVPGTGDPTTSSWPTIRSTPARTAAPSPRSPTAIRSTTRSTSTSSTGRSARS